MERPTKAQRECFQRIAPWLREEFGTLAKVHEDQDGVTVCLGSAEVHVHVEAVEESDSAVNIQAPVVRGARLDGDLLRYLLTASYSMPFGAFVLDSNDTILLQHVIMGSSCTRPELINAVRAVLETADREDRGITDRWGGESALDSQSW